MKKTSVIILVFIANIFIANSQSEHVHIYHSVYPFLERMYNQGHYVGYPLNDLPMRLSHITNAIIEIDKNKAELGNADKKLLEKFKQEFFISDSKTYTLITSETDSNQILFSGLFSNDEKFFYRNSNDETNVQIMPLASIDYMRNDENSALIGNLGFRLYGTIESNFGYNLQVTNGTLFSGERSVANTIRKYSQNIKFNVYQDDIDFTESHINYVSRWLHFNIGRESRLLGAGFGQRLIMSDNSPAMDVISAGAEFESFRYKFIHASLLAQPNIGVSGSHIDIPSKYLVTHRFALTPSWGEFAFWESIVYSNRHPDIAYLNPLSFLKSLEHALRDRDNALMGMDLTVKPMRGLLVKGSFLLDDIRFEKIGTDYWGNKTAYNLGAMLSLIPNIDLIAEYARVQPYTFSHFNQNNSVVNDGFVVSSYILPNSEKYSFTTRYWWGSRYPFELELSYFRHGDNIYSETGELIRNVGGNHLEGFRFSVDSQEVKFLDGNLEEYFSFALSSGVELSRGFNLQLNYRFINTNNSGEHFIRAMLRFDEF
jgi:hypothetical protein